MALTRYDRTDEVKRTPLTLDLDLAIWKRLEQAGETRYSASITDSPTYHIGPLAIYRVFAESEFPNPDTIRVDEGDEIVTEWAVRYIGWRKVRA
jgi:hypothetical protein